MIRFRLARAALIMAALLSTPPARAAKEGHGHPGGSEQPPQELYVKEGNSFRIANPEEKILATESPSSHGSGKTSFIDIKRYDLGIYTLVVFGLLYLFVQFVVWPRIAVGLKHRELSIQGARDEAQKDRQLAEQRLAEAKRQLDEAGGRAKAILDAAQKQAEATAARAKEDAARVAESAREQSRREVEAAKEAARQELYREAVQLASMLSAKTIRRQLSPDDHAQLLDEALAEMKVSVRSA